MLKLMPSPIAGVGVFTTEPVLAGGHVRLWGDGDYRFLTFAQAEADPEFRAGGDTWCVTDADGYHCPADFHRMSIGWYMNHSDTPNVAWRTKPDYEYFATRDIAAGEEILCDYAALTPYEKAPTAE